MKKFITFIVLALILLTAAYAFDFATEGLDINTGQSISTYVSLVSDNTAEPVRNMQQTPGTSALFQDLNANTLYYIVYGSAGYASDVDPLFIDSGLKTCGQSCTLSSTAAGISYSTVCNPDAISYRRDCVVSIDGTPTYQFYYYPEYETVARPNKMKKGSSPFILFQTVAKDKDSGDIINNARVTINNTQTGADQLVETRLGTKVDFMIPADRYFIVTHDADNFLPDDDALFVDSDLTDTSQCTGNSCELDGEDQYYRIMHTSCSFDAKSQVFLCQVSHENVLFSVFSFNRNTGAIKTVNELEVINPVNPNKIPVAATTGPYNGCINQAVTLDGSPSSDADGTIVKYSWTFGDGTTPALGKVVQHTYAQTGQYLGYLQVTDNEGYDNMVSFTATISDCQQAPVADANGDYVGNVGDLVSFSSAGSSDPEGQALTYSWNFGDGTSSNEANPQHAFNAEGNYTVVLTVTDIDGLSATDSALAYINHFTAPIADANGPYSGIIGKPISFTSAGSSDPDGSIVAYSWNFGDGQTSTLANPVHTYGQANTYTVTLTVTDNHGLKNTDSTTVTITETGTAPVAVISGPASGNVDQELTFDGSQSYDLDGSVVSYLWDFDDVRFWTYIDEGETRLYSLDGDLYKIEATDITADACELEVNDVAVTIDENGEAIVDDLKLINDGIYSYDQGGEQVMECDIGLQVLESGASASHSFDQSGDHTISLTVTDTDGMIDTATFTVSITNGVPVITSTPEGTAYVGEMYKYSVEVDDPEDGSLYYFLPEPLNNMMTINWQTGLFRWTPSDDYIGANVIKIGISDGENVIYQTFTLTVVDPDAQRGGEIELSRRRLLVKSLELDYEEVLPGDAFTMGVSLENADEDNDLEDIEITAIIDELGLRQSIGPFDLKRDKTVSKQLFFDVPLDAEPGIYDIRISISGRKDDSLHRVKYREIVVR